MENDAVHIAAQLGRLDLISVILACLAIAMTLGGIVVPWVIYRNSKKASKEEVRKWLSTTEGKGYILENFKATIKEQHISYTKRLIKDDKELQELIEKKVDEAFVDIQEMLKSRLSDSHFEINIEKTQNSSYNTSDDKDELNEEVGVENESINKMISSIDSNNGEENGN